MDSNYYTKIQKLQHLGDLKKANCTCAVHQMDREINLLFRLRLHFGEQDSDSTRT